MIKVWVDSAVLARNRARGRADPPIILLDTTTGTRTFAHELSLGPGVRMVYEPNCSNCGVVHIVAEPGKVEIVR